MTLVDVPSMCSTARGLLWSIATPVPLPLHTKPLLFETYGHQQFLLLAGHRVNSTVCAGQSAGHPLSSSRRVWSFNSHAHFEATCCDALTCVPEGVPDAPDTRTPCERGSTADMSLLSA